MFGYMRRIAQVTLLVVLIVFGSLLVIGSFDTPGWSHHHYVQEAYAGFSIWGWDKHWGDEHYTPP